MHLYVELWKAKSIWLALSDEARQRYIEGIGPKIEGLLKDGVDIVGFSLVDDDTPHRADYRYLAVWKMPSRALVEQFEASFEKGGFHDYFEQVNACGELVSPVAVFGHMIGL